MRKVSNLGSSNTLTGTVADLQRQMVARSIVEDSVRVGLALLKDDDPTAALSALALGEEQLGRVGMTYVYPGQGVALKE